MKPRHWQSLPHRLPWKPHRSSKPHRPPQGLQSPSLRGTADQKVMPPARAPPQSLGLMQSPSFSEPLNQMKSQIPVHARPIDLLS
mmetsp:Transcript_67129/g.119178  ORF Transcript_67129/g.119178 Transcript_67129/m.119178 type:complete len:85 (+) Transcript_67129:38-292(+)